MTLAYSYLRFSTSEQKFGDSSRRQRESAQSYVDEHGLELDRTITFEDVGTSAFHGRNARQGRLREFLDAVESGLIPRGSFLLVESLDRLSRDRILAAQALFLQIIGAGITVVTLIDGRAYSEESINRSPMDLIISLVAMMRANEESATKAARNRAAWDEKRRAARTRPMTARCPGWLYLDKEAGRFWVVEERAEVVRRIYREALEGLSAREIVRRLNGESIPLFGHGNQRGRSWHRAFVVHLLRTPAVIGTLIPRVTEHLDGTLRLHAREPIEGYYPAILEPAVWGAVRAKREATARKFAHTANASPVANVLAHLARCPRCGSAMVLRASRGADWRYLVCNLALAGGPCTRRYVRFAEIERLLTIGIDRVIETCPAARLSEQAKVARLGVIKSTLTELRMRLRADRAEAEAVRTMRGGIDGRMSSTGEEIAALLRARRALGDSAGKVRTSVLDARLSKLQAAARSHPFVPSSVNDALRSAMNAVVVDWPRDRLVFEWKHGCRSEIRYDPNALRKRALPGRAASRPDYIGIVGQDDPRTPSAA